MTIHTLERLSRGKSKYLLGTATKILWTLGKFSGTTAANSTLCSIMKNATYLKSYKRQEAVVSVHLESKKSSFRFCKRFSTYTAKGSCTEMWSQRTCWSANSKSWSFVTLALLEALRAIRTLRIRTMCRRDGIVRLSCSVEMLLITSQLTYGLLAASSLNL